MTVLCDSCVGRHEEECSGEIHGYEQLVHLSLVQSLGLEEFLMRKSQVLKASALGRKLQELERRQYQETRRKVQELEQVYLERLDTLHGSFEGLLEQFNREKQLSLSVDQPQTSAFTKSMLSSRLTKLPENAVIVEKAPAELLEAQIKELGIRMESGKGANHDFDQFFASIMNSGLKQSGPVGNPSTSHKNPKEGMLLSSSFVYVPFTRGPQLAKWRSDTLKLEKISLSRGLNLTHLSVSVLLPDGNMICCGGSAPHDQRVAHVNMTSGEVTYLPEMQKGRANAGVVYAENALFVFGGFSDVKEEWNTGEKYSLQSRQWSLFASCMSTARHQFTPFAHEGVIYLAGGWTTTAVEAFDIYTETFTLLPLVLPKVFPTVCLVYNCELIAFQEKRVIRWQLGSNTGERVVREIHQIVKDSNVSVQILGSKAYWTQESMTTCEIHEADLVTWEVSKLSNLSTGEKQCPVS